MEHSSHNMYTIVLLGSKDSLKKLIVTTITGHQGDFQCVSSDCQVAQSKDFRVVIAPDIFDKDNKYVDQHVLDLMALSMPGPHIFILAIDQQNEQETKILEQITTLQNIFGEVSQNLVVTLRDLETYLEFSHLKEHFNILLATVNENLASMCRDWCIRKPFMYQYNNYSEDMVKRRREVLFIPRYTFRKSLF